MMIAGTAGLYLLLFVLHFKETRRSCIVTEVDNVVLYILVIVCTQMYIMLSAANISHFSIMVFVLHCGKQQKGEMSYTAV